ncbi:MAG TPA: Uma2 family endonuclease [Tepidisphaeraceae bacterium]|nr:Uma2 family endonuclease [Tepidisphaeraceae bacterium]
MTTVTSTPPSPSPVAKFENAAEWWHALGDVPLERVVMDPPPGTATEQDLLVFVERDKRLVELIDGTLVEKPVGYEESFIALLLATALNNFVRPRTLGFVAGADATLHMRSGRVRLPDVSFVSIDDVPGRQRPKEPIPLVPPTIAAEVISQTNTSMEMRQKTKEYFESGSKLVWLIYPKTRTIAVFDRPAEETARLLTENDVLDGGDALPGFTLRVAELFPDVR